MQIPGLGDLTLDDDLGWYRSAPVPVAVLGGVPCEFILDGYDDDPDPTDFRTAIATFLALDRSALVTAAPSIFAYYRDIANLLGTDVRIDAPGDVLAHVRLGHEPIVQRDHDDHQVYISLECECAWEPEHGLQIVFRHGAAVTRIGPYDGALSSPDGLIYRPL